MGGLVSGSDLPRAVSRAGPKPQAGQGCCLHDERAGGLGRFLGSKQSSVCLVKAETWNGGKTRFPFFFSTANGSSEIPLHELRGLPVSGLDGPRPGGGEGKRDQTRTPRVGATRHPWSKGLLSPLDFLLSTCMAQLPMGLIPRCCHGTFKFAGPKKNSGSACRCISGHMSPASLCSVLA